MGRLLSGLTAAAAMGTILLIGSSTPSSALGTVPGAGFGTAEQSSIQDVQFLRRGGRGGFVGRGIGRRGFVGRGGRGFGRGFGRGGGGTAAGIAAGIAAGAILGGALAQPESEPGPAYGAPGDSVAYCQRQFRSYDPASGTYMGNDGYRHPCP
ncbi:MAG: BA14K family protein [Hyphomicrobiales bacterium]